MHTKVVATVGPATADPERVRELIAAGVNVIRINFAHGTHPEHKHVIDATRAAAKELDTPVAVLADLAGPKIRIGTLPEPIFLEAGAIVTITPEEQAQEGEIPTTHEALGLDLAAEDRILLDDGVMELSVVSTDTVRVKARVVRGGVLQSNKGMNLPGVKVTAPSLSAKDLEDLEFALEARVDYIGLSFVQRAEDVEDLRSRIPDDILIVAKIEKDIALDNIVAILEATNAVMVARGDLGVELPFEQVPVAQKRIIRLANQYGRPVITATQMLESMVEMPRPTRAEASDVANALFDGTDAVMLSGETAVGRFPVLAVEAMVRISSEIERSRAFFTGPKYDVPIVDRLRGGATPTEHAIAAATVEAVRLLDAPAIVTLTITGHTARLVSSYRPPVPILAVCEQTRTYRQLAMVWGVQPVVCWDDRTYEGMLQTARECLIERGIGKEGDFVVVTAGVPFQVARTTNMLRIEEL